MLKENTSTRLKTIMRERNLRQVDILEKAKPLCKKYKVKLNKSDLSQYVSGLVAPGQDKLAILGEVLNVNEAWLMGYDVPMDRDYIYHQDFSLTDPEAINLLKFFNRLNYQTQQEAIKRVEELTYIEKYRNTAMIKEDDYQELIFDIDQVMAYMSDFFLTLGSTIYSNKLDIDKLYDESKYAIAMIKETLPKLSRFIVDEKKFLNEHEYTYREVDINIDENKNIDHLILNAAHEIEGESEEDKQHDDDIMNDDNF